MIPAGAPVDDTIQRLQGSGVAGDVIVDSAHSNYKDSVRRAKTCAASRSNFLMWA